MDELFRIDENGQKWVTATDGKEYKVTGYPGQVKSGYMCAVDFQHEVGEAPQTGPICASLESLFAAKPCISECGWVRVLVIGVEFGKPTVDLTVPEKEPTIQ
jgi:hypothetical protein